MIGIVFTHQDTAIVTATAAPQCKSIGLRIIFNWLSVVGPSWMAQNSKLIHVMSPMNTRVVYPSTKRAALHLSGSKSSPGGLALSHISIYQSKPQALDGNANISAKMIDMSVTWRHKRLQIEPRTRIRRYTGSAEKRKINTFGSALGLTVRARIFLVYLFIIHLNDDECDQSQRLLFYILSYENEILRRWFPSLSLSWKSTGTWYLCFPTS